MLDIWKFYSLLIIYIYSDIIVRLLAIISFMSGLLSLEILIVSFILERFSVSFISL